MINLRRLLGIVLLASLTAGSVAFAATPKSGPSIIPGGSNKEPISIEADKLEYFDKEQKAVYTGNVFAKQGDSNLHCSTLTIFIDKAPNQAGPDQAAAAAPTENGQIKRLEAGGPVTITQKDQIGTGDSGIYDKAEDKFYLIGHVTLAQGKNVTTGDKLTYDLASGQALVSSGKTQGRVKGYFIPGSGSPEQKK